MIDGQLTDDVSKRCVVWQSYCDESGQSVVGLRDKIMDPKLSPESFADYILDYPLPIFMHKDGAIALPPGTTLRRLLDPETRPESVKKITNGITLQDCANVLSLMHGGIKLKPHGVVELRGTDASYELRYALAALSVGLFFDEESLAKAHAMVTDWTQEDRAYLSLHAPRIGLKTNFRDGTVQDIAAQLCRWAREGLERRGLGEASLLDPLSEIAEGRALCLSDRIAEKIRDGSSPLDVLKESAIPQPKKPLSSPQASPKSDLKK